MSGRRRAGSDEYAQRINAAVALLERMAPARAVDALAREHGLSERQARRYVQAALERPGGVAVPERTEVFTVRLPLSLIASVRAFARSRGQTLSATVAEALRSYLDHSHERHGKAR
jgi:hypothetical protein